MSGVQRFYQTIIAISIGGEGLASLFGSVPHISNIWLVKVLGQDRPSAVQDKLNLEAKHIKEPNVL